MALPSRVQPPLDLEGAKENEGRPLFGWGLSKLMQAMRQGGHPLPSLGPTCGRNDITLLGLWVVPLNAVHIVLV